MKNILALCFGILFVLNPFKAAAQMDFLGLDEEEPPAAETTDENIAPVEETTQQPVVAAPEIKPEPVADVAETPKITPQIKGSLTPVKIHDAEETAASVSPQTTDESDDFANETDFNDIMFDERKNVMNEYLQDLETADIAQKNARDIISKKPNILSLRQNQLKMIEEGEQKRREYTQRKAQEAFEEEEKPALLEIQNTNKVNNININIPQNTSDTTPTVATNTANSYKAPNITATPENKTAKAELQALTDRLESAPFGLYWDATKEEIDQLGFKLVEAEREDYQNVYEVKNPKQNKKTFSRILAIFGSQNHLYCIYAQSDLQNDDNRASAGLQLYRQYYKALEQKYGNAQEFFTPNIVYEESAEKSGERDISAPSRENPVGNDDFLNELAKNKASLYATFENENIGAVIDLLANDKQQSYITIDYKNLPVLKKEKDGLLDELIGDI